MCRILVILKRNINQKKLTMNFLSQSHNLKNTPGFDNSRDFDYHKDGYGFIFYKEDNLSFYKSSLVYKDDNNFKFIEDKIKDSDILIGHIRATKHHFKDDICYNNTHPFWYMNNFFIHNGSIFPFKPNFLKKFIDQKYIHHIKGKTDSEILFYIYLTILDYSYNEIEAWKKFIIFLKQLNNNKITISANLVFNNKNFIIVTRFINNDSEPPSLYFDSENFVISSEPVTENYRNVNKNTIFVYDIINKKLSQFDI